VLLEIKDTIRPSRPITFVAKAATLLQGLQQFGGCNLTQRLQQSCRGCNGVARVATNVRLGRLPRVDEDRGWEARQRLRPTFLTWRCPPIYRPEMPLSARLRPTFYCSEDTASQHNRRWESRLRAIERVIQACGVTFVRLLTVKRGTNTKTTQFAKLISEIGLGWQEILVG
jgi:hypothetical protein